MKRIGLPYLPDEIRNSCIKTPPALPAMTPAQLDHLSRLKHHLKTLLANAEKRALGDWEYDDDSDDLDSDGGWIYAPDRPLLSKGDASHADMAFIASCAGNAEAGWKSTLGVIDVALDCESWDGMTHEMYIRPDAERTLKTILAAWPIEKLP